MIFNIEIQPFRVWWSSWGAGSLWACIFPMSSSSRELLPLNSIFNLIGFCFVQRLSHKIEFKSMLFIYNTVLWKKTLVSNDWIKYNKFIECINLKCHWNDECFINDLWTATTWFTEARQRSLQLTSMKRTKRRSLVTIIAIAKSHASPLLVQQWKSGRWGTALNYKGRKSKKH